MAGDGVLQQATPAKYASLEQMTFKGFSFSATQTLRFTAMLLSGFECKNVNIGYKN